MSKIYAIEDAAEVRYYIAGHPTAGASYGFPSGGGITHERKVQKYEGARWPEAEFADLQNHSFQVTGTTVRSFATMEAATLFEMEETGVVRAGTLIVLWPTSTPGLFKKWTGANAVLAQTINDRQGVALTIGYTVQCSGLVAADDEPFDTGTHIADDNGDVVIDDDGVKPTDDA